MNFPASPADAASLFEQLANWGELSVYEVQTLGASAWLPILIDSGILATARTQSEAVAWHLSPRFVHLLELDSQSVGRRVCFSVPAYRDYLLGILVEGLVDAARTGMTVEIEVWTGNELSTLLPELNALLDVLEKGNRLVDLSGPDLEKRATEFPGRGGAFANWDLFALGHGGRRPKALFEFVLHRFVPSSAPLPPAEDFAAVIRSLPLNREDGFSLDCASVPSSWNIQRNGVFSGVTLFDEHGRSMLDENGSLDEVLVEFLQDALVQHPFYRAVVHLAICAWRSPASTMPTVELHIPGACDLHDTSILLGSHSVGWLSDLLGDLVCIQGFAPFGLVDGRVPNDLIDNLLRNLLELRILCRRDEILALDENYQGTLMASPQTDT